MAPKKKNKSESAVKKKSEKAPQKINSCWIIVSIVVLMIAVASYQAYKVLLTVPDMPEIELDTWWGASTSKEYDKSIRPYRIVFSDSMQENIRRKFENYRSMTKVKSLNESSSYGLNLDAVAQLFAHWQFKYTFRHRAHYLNKFEHYKTNIQGLDIHYVRVKPQVEQNTKVVPILLLHGWPSSIKEFYEVIPILTSQNSDYNFVFEVIAPSLPGFIYSQAPAKPGLSAYQMAIVMRNLMERLGFNKFYVHGGDIGHAIGTHIATIFPSQVLGFHTSFPVNLSKVAQLAWMASEIWQNIMKGGASLSPVGNKLAMFMEESGYLHLQATKPDTIGTSLQDSPIGLAAYIVDRILAFTDPSYKDLPDGGLSTFNATDLIDNVMLYWNTGSITTSLRLFKENVRNWEVEEKLSRIPTSVPTWGLRVKRQLIHQSNIILHWKYLNLIGTTTLDVGGHFSAFEIPVEVAGDIFKAINHFMNPSKQK